MGKAFKQGRKASEAPVYLNSSNTTSFAIPSSYHIQQSLGKKAKLKTVNFN